VRDRRRQMRHAQRGTSLIEVLIATAIMGPLTLAGITGLMTAINASDAAQTTQSLQVALSSATENVKALPYLECADAEKYQALYKEWTAARPLGIVKGVESSTPVVQQVTYWDPTTSDYVEKCAQDGGAQQFTLAVIADGRTAEGTIVKRDPAATPR